MSEYQTAVVRMPLSRLRRIDGIQAVNCCIYYSKLMTIQRKMGYKSIKRRKERTFNKKTGLRMIFHEKTSKRHADQM